MENISAFCVFQNKKPVQCLHIWSDDFSNAVKFKDTWLLEISGATLFFNFHFDRRNNENVTFGKKNHSFYSGAKIDNNLFFSFLQNICVNSFICFDYSFILFYHRQRILLKWWNFNFRVGYTLITPIVFITHTLPQELKMTLSRTFKARSNFLLSINKYFDLRSEQKKETNKNRKE